MRSIHDAAHFYVSVDVDLSSVQSLRAKCKKNGGLSPSINDFILWASARTLRMLPVLNSSLDGDTLTIFEDVNVGMVTLVDDKLAVPVIRAADALDVHAIGVRSRELALRARARKLLPSESEGGTFTVSNLGMHGVDSFTGIIFPGQAAILAVGRVSDRAVVEEKSVVVRTMATMTLSVDHRIADGVIAAQFLAGIGGLLDDFDAAGEGTSDHASITRDREQL